MNKKTYQVSFAELFSNEFYDFGESVTQTKINPDLDIVNDYLFFKGAREYYKLNSHATIDRAEIFSTGFWGGPQSGCYVSGHLPVLADFYFV